MINQKLLQTYIENEFNVLIQGKHGIGKTMVLTEACKNLGLNLKYYSASSLDPYTDLVGVPEFITNESGERVLRSVRPQEINDAEVVFFDELNRADPKVLNAVFELIQFRTINGEPLPNLKCVVAAQNPPEDEYHVESLDAALADRFQITLEIEPELSPSYLRTVLQEDTVDALVKWHKSHGERVSYVSPRRVEMIGHVWEATNDRYSLFAAMPPGKFDVGKLFNLLSKTALPEDLEKLVDGESVKSTIREIGPNRIESALNEATEQHKTIALNNIALALRNQFGPATIVLYLDIIDLMDEDQVGVMTGDWTPAKKKHIGLEAEIKAHTGTKGMSLFKAALDDNVQ